MNKSPFINPRFVLLCFIIAGAVTVNLRSCRSQGPSYDWENHYQVIGHVIGEEVAQLLGTKAGIVVQRYDGPNPILDKALAVLEHAGLRVLATETVAFSMEPITTDERYVELCQKYPDAAAILTYSDDPHFTQPTPAALPNPHPQLIIIGSDAVQMQQYCDAGWLSLAFVTRQGKAGDQAGATDNGRIIFEESFQIIRP